MQEEVTQKTMALAITTSRMTASILAKAMRKFLEAQKKQKPPAPQRETDPKGADETQHRSFQPGDHQ